MYAELREYDGQLQLEGYGCGCCGNSERVKNVSEIDAHIAELKAEIDEAIRLREKYFPKA